MRIISGTLRGRKLLSPKGNDVRPTTDKVREAVFDILYQYTDTDYVVFDVFAGSGSMGLEAISRGASKVFFSDNSRESLALVKENVNICGVGDKAVFLSGDYLRNIARVKEKIDVYFLDPPYANGYILPALRAIDEAGRIDPDGIVVCEHSFRDKMPESAYGFTRVKSRKYGAIGIAFYQRGEREEVE